MNNLTAICDIQAGKASFLKENEFRQALKSLSDGRYIVTFEKHFRKRSTNQNSYLWAVPYKLIQDGLIELGYTEAKKKEWVHEFCKENFLPGQYLEKLQSEKLSPIINKKTGEIIEPKVRLTTTKMTTGEAMEYYSNLQQFASEYLNIEIPNPNE